MNERLLCLDIGDARIGVAVSDASRLIASPVEVIHSVGWGPDCRRVCELARQYDTSLIVSGLPLNMDGTEGFQAKKVKGFCARLEEAGLTVTFQDERLTTVTAEDALLEGGFSRQERKQRVDKVAAAIILQQYLDAQRAAAQTAQARQKEEHTMSEANDNIIELLDEEDNTVRFEHLATLERDEHYYICLAPLNEDEEAGEEVDVLFMEIVQDEEGAESYVPVEDEDLEEELFNQFMELVDEEEEDGDAE